MFGDAHQAGVVTALLIKDVAVLAITFWLLYKLYKSIAKKHSK